ncbi:MAG TPA: ribosomal protein L7/L12 [Acidimicrobiales bacterium]|nr:ribosomal protein L7/L12 [Acidimicrobiales bacterium]
MEMEDRVRINQRLADLEHNVGRLLGQAGMTWEAAPVEQALGPDVIQALQDGNMIEAIKRHREATGLGLAEAKAAVEGYAGR